MFHTIEVLFGFDSFRAHSSVTSMADLKSAAEDPNQALALRERISVEAFAAIV